MKTHVVHHRVVDADHPWLGLESFTEATQKYFFGRSEEIAEIFVRTRENPLTILYGQSGLGKTSLLGAGLIPKLTLEGLRPVLIRLRYEATDAPLIDQVKYAIGDSLTPRSGERAVTGAQRGFAIVYQISRFKKHSSLWEYFHHIASRDPSFASSPPVLIFDQFEEAFTLGQRAERLEEVRALFTELADVVENRPPAALKQRFTEDRKLVREYDLTPSPLRIVITLREDYLSHLLAWKVTLPSLMRNHMALHLLSGPQALDAAMKPGQMEGRRLVDEETAARIVRFVANRASDVPLAEIGAVPPLLSLVCDELNTQRLEQKLDSITAERISAGGLADEDDLEARSRVILQRFYQRSFAGFPQGVQSFVEDRMVTVAGHRCPVSRDDAIDALRKCKVKDPAETMQALVSRRLISTEERGGIPWFEITHDVLVPIVKESKDKRLARQRLRRLVLASMGLLALLAVFGGITAWALKAQRAAQASETQAAAQRDEARYNEGLAWLLRAEVAEERSKRYPDTLLYAAQAIGFEGLGRRPGAELPLRYIPTGREAFQRAAHWVADRPAYRPVWASPLLDSPVTAMRLSPSGRWLAQANADGRVVLWNLADGKATPVLSAGSAAVGDLAFDPQELSLTLLTTSDIKSFDLAKKSLAIIHPGSTGTSAAFSPGGDMLAVGSRDGKIALWQGGKSSVLTSDISVPAERVAFSPENSLIAAAYPGKGVRVFYPHAGTAANAWTTHVADAGSVAVSPDGTRLAIGTADGAVSLWSAADATQLGIVPAELRHKAAVLDLAFRPDGRQLASASADHTVKLWDVSKGIPTVLATLCGHSSTVSRVAFTPGGDFLASAGADGSARLWSVVGKPEAPLDLMAYLDQRFYAFDPATQHAQWAGGAGFVGAAPSMTGAKQDRAALLADAQKAAKEQRWHRVDLRLAQLGKADDPAIAPLRFARAAFGKEGQPFTNAEGMNLRWCPPTGPEGFLMGSPETEKDRYSYETQHKVVLTKGFWLGQYEVTQAEWKAVMGTEPSTNIASGPQAPVENISWTEATEFCRRLTDRERARGTLPAGWEYALPSEAQWEYACRAGTTTAYSFGDDPALLHLHGNYNDKSGGFSGAEEDNDDGVERTAPVGSYKLKETKPNAWGFFDMHGNVFEWCADALDPENADYSGDATTDPLGTQGTHRVNRGGGWSSSARDCRSASRFAIRPSYRNSFLGFRPAVVPSRPVDAVTPEKGKMSGSESVEKR